MSTETAKHATLDARPENVAADTYWALADMIEPHVAREGINPDGLLPASVYESVQILLEHWIATHTAQGGQGEARALIQRYDAAGAKFRESLMDDLYSDVQRVEFRQGLAAVQDELIAALAVRQPVDLSSLERRDPEVWESSHGSYWEMAPHADGEWVRFSDVEALVKGGNNV